MNDLKSFWLYFLPQKEDEKNMATRASGGCDQENWQENP